MATLVTVDVVCNNCGTVAHDKVENPKFLIVRIDNCYMCYTIKSTRSHKPLNGRWKSGR